MVCLLVCEACFYKKIEICLNSFEVLVQKLCLICGLQKEEKPTDKKKLERPPQRSLCLPIGLSPFLSLTPAQQAKPNNALSFFPLQSLPCGSHVVTRTLTSASSISSENFAPNLARRRRRFPSSICAIKAMISFPYCVYLNPWPPLTKPPKIQANAPPGCPYLSLP